MVHKTGVFPCPDCAKTFSRLEYVNRHRRLKHWGVRPWVCPCGASYARSDLLSRHKRKCRHSLVDASDTQAPQSGCSSSTKIADDSLIRGGLAAVGYPAESIQEDQLMSAEGDVSGVSGDQNLGCFSADPPPYDQVVATSKSTYIHQQPQLSDISQPRCDDSQIAGQTPSHVTAAHSIPAQTESSWVQGHSEESGGLLRDPLGGFVDISEVSALAEPIFSTPVPRRNLENLAHPELRDSALATKTLEEDEEDSEPNHPARLLSSDVMIKYSHPNFFRSDEPESSPFYLNPNLWILAFLCQKAQGFTIPSIGELSRFARTATHVMLPVFPMIHLPTFRTSSTTIHLGYAVCVAGAAADPSEHARAFTEQSLSYKRPLVQQDFLGADVSFDFRFELLQTLLTYQFLGMFNRLPRQKARAVKFGPTIVRNLKFLGLEQIVRDAPDYVKLILNGVISLDEGWRSWVKYESHKRTVFLVLISSFQISRDLGFEMSDIDLKLPCHEDLWTAPTAQKWFELACIHTRRRTDFGSRLLGGEEGLSWDAGELQSAMEVIGEESIPMLSDALAALQIRDDQPHVGEVSSTSQIVLQTRRLGGFAQTVLQHCQSLNFLSGPRRHAPVNPTPIAHDIRHHPAHHNLFQNIF